jgi:fibronectin type 3 domain-containing protein
MKREDMRKLMLVLWLSSLVWAQQGIGGKVQFIGGATVSATNHVAALSWSACAGASSYNVYRGTVHGGPYQKIIVGVTTASATDQNAQHAATYYYVVTAVNSYGESGYSNETVVKIP